MDAEESLKQGNLDQALAELQDSVRKDPSNAEYRVFLFQLLSLLGQWDRALTQLNVSSDIDAGNLAMAQTYREALQCEALRAEVFAGKRAPMIFGQPAEWVALLVQALKLTADGAHAESQQLRDKAFDAAPATSGKIGDTAFEWIADADPRLGPVLEAIINGHYYWVPFDCVKEIAIEEPEDLRDFAWTPAFFTWANGGEAVGLIPTRYPGSAESGDPELQLARKTEWIEQPGGLFLGVGQRLIATDQQEYSLMELRQITLNTIDTSGDETAAEDAGSTDG